MSSKLTDYNLEIPQCVSRILIEDKHLIEDDRFVSDSLISINAYKINNILLQIFLLDLNFTCKMYSVQHFM